MSNTLYLPLKRRWFNAFKYDDKGCEYRKITPTWISRLLVWHWQDENGVWYNRPISKGGAEWHAKHIGILKELLDKGHLVFNNFDNVILTDGYPRKDDKERHLQYPILKIDIGTPNLKWVPEGTPHDEEFFRIHVKKQRKSAKIK